ncbi:hypothetical protein FHS85_003328 [Rhodoligotrophos appendicifer]
MSEYFCKNDLDKPVVTYTEKLYHSENSLTL